MEGKGPVRAALSLPRKAVLILALAAVLCPAAAVAGDAARELRIGVIGADPGPLLLNFDPFVEYLRSSLRQAGVRDVTVFVAKDLNRLRTRIQNGTLDCVLISAFPLMQMEQHALVPAVSARRGAAREDSAVFFVRDRSGIRDLRDLRGKTLAFGKSWSTSEYAVAAAELYGNQLSLSELTDKVAPDHAVRYFFAGEPVNQAFRVIRFQADSGVMSAGDWDELPLTERSHLRIIHHTRPMLRLLGSFLPSVPPDLRETVVRTLVDMAGNRKGQAALARAFHVSAFERLTAADRSALERYKLELSNGAE